METIYVPPAIITNYKTSSAKGWFYQAGQAHYFLDTCISLCNGRFIDLAELKFLEDTEHADTDNCTTCMEIRNALAKERNGIQQPLR